MFQKLYKCKLIFILKKIRDWLTVTTAENSYNCDEIFRCVDGARLSPIWHPLYSDFWRWTIVAPIESLASHSPEICQSNCFSSCSTVCFYWFESNSCRHWRLCQQLVPGLARRAAQLACYCWSYLFRSLFVRAHHGPQSYHAMDTWTGPCVDRACHFWAAVLDMST